MADVARAKAIRVIESGAWRETGTLVLKDLGLRTVPEELLALRGLRELDLSGNRLSTLSDGSFEMTSLERLNVAENRLRLLPAELGHLTRLRSLDASENAIATLDPGIAQCRALASLDLYRNSLTDVSALAALPALRELDLSRNLLRTFPELGANGSLVRLDLSANEIEAVPAPAAVPDSLRWLDLSHNKLTRLELRLADPAAELFVAGNLLVNREPTNSTATDLVNVIAANTLDERREDRDYLFDPVSLIAFTLAVSGLPAIRAALNLYYKHYLGRISLTVRYPDGSRADLRNLSRRAALQILAAQHEAAVTAPAGLSFPDSQSDRAISEFAQELLLRNGEITLIPDRPGALAIHFHRHLGETVMGDHITIGDVSGSNVTIRSRLEHTVQTVSTAPGDDETKARLSELIGRLSAGLAELPTDLAEDADAVSTTVEQLVAHASQERPNRKLIGVAADTLRRLAAPLAAIEPLALEIIKLVNTLVGNA